MKKETYWEYVEIKDAIKYISFTFIWILYIFSILLPWFFSDLNFDPYVYFPRMGIMMIFLIVPVLIFIFIDSYYDYKKIKEEG